MATKQGGNISLVLEVLNLPDILTDIVKHLTRHEAVKLRAVCKALRSTFKVIQDTAQYKQRLLVVDSESNELFEFDPVTADFKLVKQLKGLHSRTKKTTKWWPTSIALCPYNGDFYVCQDVGQTVRRSNGWSLDYVRIGAKLPARLSSPEGVCFSKQSMYVVSAGAAAIARFPWDSESGEFAALAEVFDELYYERIPGRAMVPWNMITGPDGNLFLAVDVASTRLDTHMENKGSILHVWLGDQGEFQKLEDDAGNLYDRPGVDTFCGWDGRLRRPTGLAFDGQGYLYVTSFIAMGQVLVYKGPLMDRPGDFVRVAVAWDDAPLTQGLGALLPCDVQWSPGIPGIGTGPLLFVVRHTGRNYYELRANNWPYSRVSIYCAVSGACIKEISCSLLKTPNAIALA